MQIKNVRFIIAAITTFSAYAVYVSRTNLSITIIAMVDDNHASDHHEAVNQQSPSNSSKANSQMDNQQLSSSSFSFERLNNGFNSTNSSATTTTTTSRTLANVFVKSRDSFRIPLISQEKFHWDMTEQALILGAFFYGYIIFQIPGARIAESVGARWIIMASSAGSAVISLAFPLSTQLNSIHLLMVLRFVMGLCQSAFFPAAYCLFCRWLPERERSVLLPIMFIGSNMGTISTYIMSSYLISSHYGWPSVFYLSGWICLLCSLLWGIFGSNGPEDNWWITSEERKMIVSNVNNQSSESNSLNQAAYEEEEDDLKKPKEQRNQGSNLDDGLIITKPNKQQQQQQDETRGRPLIGKASTGSSITREVTPAPSWSKLIFSIPVWTLILSMYGNEWSNVVLCYELPSYLNTALNYPIEQNGVINSFFQLSYTVASPIMSSLGAYMLDNHLFGMRKVHVRKLFQSLATFGQLACFVSVPICGANRGLIMMFMFLAIVFKACANAGDIMVSGDLSPEYAGTIFAFANSFGNTAGFFVPLLAAAFTGDSHERVKWTPFWLATAAIMGFSGLIFLFFGETRRQDFSKDPKVVPIESIDLRSFQLRSDIIKNKRHHHHHHARLNHHR